MHPFAVRADPGGAIAHPPRIFRKTGWTDGKTTGTGPAEGKSFLAAMAGMVLIPATAWFFATIFRSHAGSLWGQVLQSWLRT
jgi:hypothetical protein